MRLAVPPEIRNRIPTSRPRHQADSRSSQTPSPTIVIEPPIHVPAGPRPFDLAAAPRSVSRPSQRRPRLPPQSHRHPTALSRTRETSSTAQSPPHTDGSRPCAAAKKRRNFARLPKAHRATVLQRVAMLTPPKYVPIAPNASSVTRSAKQIAADHASFP